MDAWSARCDHARAGSDNGTWLLAAGAAPLLLGEAFVSAAGKPALVAAGQHAADAVAAGRALVELLDDAQPLSSSVCCSQQGSFNLLAAMALRAASA
jgi:hypothetical protein